MFSVIAPGNVLAYGNIIKEFSPLHKCTLALINDGRQNFFDPPAQKLGYAFV